MALMTELTVERPHSATEPFTAELRVIRGQTMAVVVDRRTDRAEIRCDTLEGAEALARHMNRDARKHAAQEWP